MSFAPEFREISLNECDLQSLLIEARREGFGFLDRLMEDWNDGSNRFNRDGEKLVGAFGENTLIWIGGLNRDPYCRAQIGRLRHLFIHPKHRGTGVGRKLVEILIEDAH